MAGLGRRIWSRGAKRALLRGGPCTSQACCCCRRRRPLFSDGRRLPFSGAAAPTSRPHGRRKVNRLVGTPQADPRSPRRPCIPGKVRVVGFGCGLVTARTGHSRMINVHRGHTNVMCPGDSWPVRSGGSPHNCGFPGLSRQEPRAGGDQAHGGGRQHCSLRPLQGVQEGDAGQEAAVRSAERRPRQDPSRSPTRNQSFPRNRAREGLELSWGHLLAWRALPTG